MSLFIGGLAFAQTGINQIFDERVGILTGSLVSACLGILYCDSLAKRRAITLM